MAGSCRLLWVGLLGLVVLAEAGPARVGIAVGAEPGRARVAAAPARVGLALEALDECARRLNPDVDVGYDRIVARCPTLVRRLQDSGVAVWLPRDWQRPGNDLSAGGLRELRELLAHELRVSPPPGAHPLGVQQVPEILASLTRADDEHSGWWARTRAWLRNIFAGSDEATDEGWLGRMIGQSGLSQTVLELVSYGALGLVVVLALAIVANELRVAGVWGRGRRGSLLAAGPAAASGGDRLDWGVVESSPLAQRLGLLLELVVARLNESGGARLSRGLTARELLQAAPLADERDRERLGALARASERARFSGGGVSEAEVAAVMEEGRRLLEGIGVFPSAPSVRP